MTTGSNNIRKRGPTSNSPGFSTSSPTAPTRRPRSTSPSRAHDEAMCGVMKW